MDGEAVLSGKRGKTPMTAGGFSESSFMSRELYTDHVMTSSSGRVSCCSTELTCAIHNSSFILAPCTRLWYGRTWLMMLLDTNTGLLPSSTGCMRAYEFGSSGTDLSEKFTWVAARCSPWFSLDRWFGALKAVPWNSSLIVTIQVVDIIGGKDIAPEISRQHNCDYSIISMALAHCSCNSSFDIHNTVIWHWQAQFVGILNLLLQSCISMQICKRPW